MAIERRAASPRDGDHIHSKMGEGMKKYHGHCHCGAVQFELDSELNLPMQCDCSYCTRRATIFQMEPITNFQLLKGRDEMTRYGSKEISDHFFCKTCGISTFTYLKDKGAVVGAVVNLACLDGTDTARMKPMMVDGKNL